MEIFEKLWELINFSYLLAVILLVWVVLTYIILNPTRIMKILVHLLSGVLLGVVWYLLNLCTPEVMIVSFLSSILMYNWVIKVLLDKLGITYNNDRGII